MSDYISSLFALTESEDVWSDDASHEDDLAEAQWAREKRVTTLLHTVVQRMGLDLREGSNPVLYSEDDREATIDIFDSITLEQIAAFGDIASGIKVGSSGHQDVVRITMTINAGVEDATIS